MNVTRFAGIRTQDQALDHLERARWRGEPTCPYCGSVSVGRHASSDRGTPRWECRECSRPFSALVGTFLQGTHVPLRDWFLVLGIATDESAVISANAISRELGIRRGTVGRMLRKIEDARNDASQRKLIERIFSESEINKSPHRGAA